MTRFARYAMPFIAMFSLDVTAVHAQTPTPAPAQGAFSADVFAAATLGHKSASAFGGEIGYRLTDTFEVFLEGGHMGNVTTTSVEALANVIARHLNGTANVVQKVNFGDLGVKFHFPTSGMWHPYVAFGVGLAQVSTATTVSANNADVSVAFGLDLNGRVNKPLIVFGGGVQVPFGSRFFADGSYRFGQILAKTGTIDNDTSIPTQRVQFGVGLRF